MDLDKICNNCGNRFGSHVIYANHGEKSFCPKFKSLPYETLINIKASTFIEKKEKIRLKSRYELLKME